MGFTAPIVKTKTGGFTGGFTSAKPISTKPDLSELGGLKQQAETFGLGEEAAKITDTTPKLSFLQRLGKGLGAFNPAEAILTGMEKGAGAGILEYGKDIVKGIGSAITGTDYEGQRRTFSDVAEKMGVTNKIAKFGIGFAGDVLLDPTTYFGGAIAKGLGLVTKGTAGLAVKGIGKIAPEAETGLKMAGTALQDALGKAFQYGYKASKGAKEDILTFISKEQKAKLGLAASNLDRLGTGVLTNSQREELALKMIAGKRTEFLARNAKPEEFMSLGKEFPEYIQKDILEYQFLKDDVMADPARKLAKYANKKTGELPEVLGWGKGIFGKRGDDIVTEVGFKDSEEAREAYLKYAEKAKRLEQKRQSLVGSKKAFKEEKDLDAFLATGAAENIKSMAGQFAKEAAQSVDPMVQKKIEEQILRNKKMGEQLGLENPYEVYFPFIKKNKLDKFLSETKGLKVGSEGYRKQFRNLLTNENMELDPAKAFFTRESQIVTDRMTRDFLNGFVKKYGKGLDAFANSDEAAKAGYQLIKEKGIFGNPVGYVKEFDAKLIRDSISPEFQTINMLAKATGFDALTSLFKRSVTGLFAPFHVRNFVSGQIQNFETLGVGALNPKNIAIGQKIAYLMGKNEKIPAGVVNLGGKEMKFSQVMKPFLDRFSGDTFYNADFDFALKSGSELKSVAGLFSKTRLKETAKTAGLGQEAIPFKVGRAVGQFIEHQQKATAYITALAQGKNVDDALKIAETAGFDYRALTKFESQIMRRLIPFYSFTRKNIELQLKTLGENPQRINQVLAFFRSVGEAPTEEEKQNLPDFIRESIGIKLQDTPEGLKQYISSFGTPIEAFTQLFGNNPVLRAISMSNPILKTPIELGIGKDSFRQQDLKDVYTANEYKLAPQVIKDLLQIKEVQKPIYETKNGKAVKVGEKTAYIADPERLLIARSLFTSRGVSYLDQVFGGDMQGFVKFLKTTTGIKPQQVDIESQKFFNERDKQKALEDLLIRYGVVKKFENVYVPKK